MANVGDTRPLVGRETELGTVLSALEAGREADSVSLLIVGDAGVGKTSLVRTALIEATKHNDIVLVGGCIHRGAALPYLPVVDALLAAIRDTPDFADVLMAHSTVTALVSSSHEVRLETRELFDDVLALLMDLTKNRPVVLVVEDVHWADASTRDLLGFLLARLPGSAVTVILTVRADDVHRRHPLRPALAEWTRLPGVERVQLEPLDQEQIRVLVASRHAGLITPEQMNSVVSRSSGNPFLAEQLLDALDRRETLPSELADLVLVQVDGLSNQSRRIVELVAVAGNNAPYDLIAAVAQVSDDELETALREAVDSHVLVPVGTASYGFRHALLAEAVYDDLLAGKRVRLHSGFSEAIVAGASGTDADLARHAEESFDLSTAYAAALRAADAALSLGAPADALLLFERASRIAGQVPESDVVQLAIGTAEAAALAGHPFKAVAEVEAALADLADDDTRRAELLVLVVQYQMWLDAPSEPEPLIREALDLLPEDPPSELRARAWALLAHLTLSGNDAKEALRIAGDALAMAQALASPAVAADAATVVARASVIIGDSDVAERTLVESLDQAAASGDAWAELRACHALGRFLDQRGDLDAALDAYQRGCDRAAALGRPWATYAADCRAMQVLLLAQTGRLRDSAELALPPGDVATTDYVRSLLAAMSLEPLGALDDSRIERAISAAEPGVDGDGMIAINVAFARVAMLGRRGEIEGAIAAHDAALVHLTKMWGGYQWFSGRVRLHAILLGILPPSASARADGLIANVGKVRERLVERVPHLNPEAQAWIARAGAEHARLMWRSGSDAVTANSLVTAWHSTVELYGYGNVLEQTRSRIRLAEMLSAVGRVGESEAEAERAVEAARRMGSERLADEARSLLTKLHNDAPRILTSREHQVLELVAEGLSNRDIGSRLFISTKTVSVHVSNVLAKLDASSRTEAVAFARRDGLLAAMT